MASLLTRHACRRLQLAAVQRYSYIQQGFHTTPAAQKKRRAAEVEVESLFDDFDDIPEPSKSPTRAVEAAPKAAPENVAASSAAADTSAVEKDTRPRRRKKLSADERLKRYNDLLDFVRPRIGLRPKIKSSQVRESAWQFLIQLATTEAQLDTVAELMPEWQNTRRAFSIQTAELFARRCEELKCPLIALRVFGDHSKYMLTLTLTGARQLLHALHVEHPLEATIAASALYRVYGLPPVSEDLVSCSLVVSACFKQNTKDSLAVANALVPHLRAMISKTAPLKIVTDPLERSRDKPRAWTIWALKKIDKALTVQHKGHEEEVYWLRMWRKHSGHLAA